MDTISDRDLYEQMELDSNAIAERSEEGVYPLAPGESFSIGDNFENLTMQGTADILAAGNGAANVLDGGAGADTQQA